jgi:hypothetical protein
MCLSASLCFGQSTQPTREPPQPADEATAREAKEGYAAAKQALLDLDYNALARMLADNRRPMLPTDMQTDASVAEMAEKLKAMQDLKKAQQLLSDAEAKKPEFGPVTMQETTTRNMKVVWVKMPLLGTRELAEKQGLGKGRWTTDDEGNLAVLMVKHEGSWYWNPFGW